MLPGVFQSSNTSGPNPVWLSIMNIFSQLISPMFLVAGIIFLKRKSYAIPLMYIILTLSVVSRFASIFITASQSGSEFPWKALNIFTMIGPVIDVLFLIIVYRISKYYFVDPDKEVYFWNTGQLGQPALKRLSVSGLVVLLIPLSLFLLWEYVAFKDLGYPESSEEYRRYLPSFLQARFAGNYLGVFCSILAFMFSSMGLKLQEKGWRRLNTTVLILGILFLAINLWSMM